MKKQVINIPSGVKYLSEVFTNLPENCIFDKGKVGCGGTTLALENNEKYVVAVPFLSLIENKVGKYDGKVFGFFGGVKKAELDSYLNSVEVPKIMVTYDSLEKLIGWLSDYSEYRLLVDEMHLLFTQYSFRRDAAKCVLDNYLRFRSFCFMTATILEDEFILDELIDVDAVIAKWETVEEVEVQSVKCLNSVSLTVAQLIKDFLSDKYNGNAYFFVNSVEFIKEMVQLCDLDNTNTRAIWSKNNKVETGLNRGKASDSPKKINLLTSTCFEGCDIFDENGYVFIVSDNRKAHTLVDISTSFQQIAGRIRNTKFGNQIYHIFTQTRYSGDISYDEFKLSTLTGIEEAKGIVIEYNNLSEIARIKIASVANEAYVDKVGNNFIFDPNLVKIDLYNFKISKCIYKLRANLNDEYTKNGYKVSTFNHSAIEIVMMDGVADKSFKEIVIELTKLPKFNFDDSLYIAACTKYPFLREAINKLGFDGIEQCKYNISNIKSKLIVRSDSDSSVKIFKMLKSKSDVSNGEFIPTSKLKSHFEHIYNELGLLDKKIKGTDILKYYEVKGDKEMSKSVNGKTVKGYVLIRSKILFN